MTDEGWVMPRDVAIAGAVSSMEEAVQMHQMRFILQWAIHVQDFRGRSEAVPRGP
jgi:hypothetical protein